MRWFSRRIFIHRLNDGIAMKIKFFFLILLSLTLGIHTFAQAAQDTVPINAPADAKVVRIDVKAGDKVFSGDTLAILKTDDGTTIILKAGVSGTVTAINMTPYRNVSEGSSLGTIEPAFVVAERPVATEAEALPNIATLTKNLFKTTGIYGIIDGQIDKDWTVGLGRILMILVGLTLLYLGIFKQFEPLLLIPIGYGAILANIPLAGIAEPGGILYYIYEVGIVTGIFPLLIFMGVGALTDFGPMIANPKTILLGGAAQVGIFVTLARCSVSVRLRTRHQLLTGRCCVNWNYRRC